LALINPFALLIAVIRDPIQGIIPPASIYVLSILMMVIGWMATIFLLNRVSKRIPFWV
jgi:lipopolysaccharide transport system permease protein